MLHLLSVGVHFGERTLFEGLDLAIGNKDRIGPVSYTHLTLPTRIFV